jgi:Flp pilus assembly protein TadG
MALNQTIGRNGILTRLGGAIRAFRGDRRGVGAVEFALVAPVLIILYIGSLEISVAMSVNKKIARASSTVADLVTQQSSVDKTFLATMVNVTQSVISPFKTTGLGVKITGITIDAAGKATVAWSWKQGGSEPYAKKSAVTIPSQLQIPSTFLIRSEVQMDYELLLVMPGLSDMKSKQITMSKTYHLRQRIGDPITCGNCGA